jgi:hypothetical protein
MAGFLVLTALLDDEYPVTAVEESSYPVDGFLVLTALLDDEYCTNAFE